jgi:hypothetical protein
MCSHVGGRDFKLLRGKKLLMGEATDRIRSYSVKHRWLVTPETCLVSVMVY